MSNEPATNAPAAATPETTNATAKVTTVPKSIRDRVLGVRQIPPTETEKAAAAEKEASDKAAADKAKADAEAKAKETAAADAGPTTKLKKAKAGPPLPEKKPAAADPGTELRDTVRQVLAESGAAAGPAKTKLSPEQERELELAQFAEQTGGEQYAGFAEKLTTFYGANQEHLTEKAKELGGPQSAEFKEYIQSDEYRGFLREVQPRYANPADKSKFTEKMIESRAREATLRELDPKLKEMERKNREITLTPIIQQKTQQAVQHIITDVREPDKREEALTEFVKDPTKFGEEFPEEARLIASTANEYAGYVEEIYRVNEGLVPVDQNPKQQAIRTYMTKVNRVMQEKNPSGLEMPDGKILVDAITYTERGLQNDPRYRTWTADEMAGMMSNEGNDQLIKRLQQRREGLQKSFFTRKPKETIAAPATTTQPAAGDPPSPGAVTRAAPNTASKTPPESKSLARKYA